MTGFCQVAVGLSGKQINKFLMLNFSKPDKFYHKKADALGHT